MPDWNDIADKITLATGQPFRPGEKRPVGGGSINEAWKISEDSRTYFVKLNSAHRVDMFEAESEGLNEIANSHSVRVPQPVCYGRSGNNSYIVMEYLELGHGDSAAALGQQLAQMHRTRAEIFGWSRDNTIGSTPQINTESGDWVEFYGDHRLGYQLSLPGARGYGRRMQDDGERLIAHLPAFFTDYQPQPSLLHGDLWGGNYATDISGAPVIYDPAVYYGDREADIAMTELFGGFGSRFYDAYNEAWPLDPGYAVRKTLYNLYHVLNHLNLFGGGYGGQAQTMIGRLLSELR